MAYEYPQTVRMDADDFAGATASALVEAGYALQEPATSNVLADVAVGFLPFRFATFASPEQRIELEAALPHDGYATYGYHGVERGAIVSAMYTFEPWAGAAKSGHTTRCNMLSQTADDELVEVPLSHGIVANDAFIGGATPATVATLATELRSFGAGRLAVPGEPLVDYGETLGQPMAGRLLLGCLMAVAGKTVALTLPDRRSETLVAVRWEGVPTGREGEVAGMFDGHQHIVITGAQADGSDRSTFTFESDATGGLVSAHLAVHRPSVGYLREESVLPTEDGWEYSRGRPYKPGGGEVPAPPESQPATGQTIVRMAEMAGSLATRRQFAL